MYSGNRSWRTPPSKLETLTPHARAVKSQQATSIGLLACACPMSAESIASLTNARLVGSTPTTAGDRSDNAARAPLACAGKYVVPRGHTSPHPWRPLSDVTQTSVDDSETIFRPPDMTYVP